MTTVAIYYASSPSRRAASRGGARAAAQRSSSPASTVKSTVAPRGVVNFRFELDFQPGGEILLRVTGPEGTKQFISEAFLASSP